eukprot:TRINITY_DN75819_c0_g1_i1.p1 TRINITY_DN75819_c0_g1~~TRINITY_DN75819_c0_g1_i1.p1  ORF type:complete len:499 (-),score=30.57 TRINITY_DN75819_c0_g1_i1:334-1830(-)
MGQKRKKGNAKDGEHAVEEAPETPAEYEFAWSSGVRLRLVRPYRYCFRTFTKERWMGRSILEVCSAEFGAQPPEYYREAILDGRMKVSGVVVSPDYILCNGDAITHETMRHEPPVLAGIARNAGDAQTDASKNVPPIDVVGVTEDLVAVDKPPTMPVHPSGAYHHNTLLHILGHEQPRWRRGVSCALHTVHRLDRLTSGLVLLATSPAVARKVCSEIADGKVQKEYLARVRGSFPCAKQDTQLPAPWLSATISRVDSTSSLYTYSEEAGPSTRSECGRRQAEGCESVMGTAGSQDSPCPGGGTASGLSYARLTCSSDGAVKLDCPIRCASHRDGVHECHPDGRYAATVFSVIGYDATSDTSLVRCSPVTGRTHQIRVHLQQLGFPIANDPCYGGSITASGTIAEAGEAKEGKTSKLFDNGLTETDTNEVESASGARGAVGSPAPAFTEIQLRCRGIWLHALKYSGPNFSFSTSLPPWAELFEPSFAGASDTGTVVGEP